MIRAAPEHLRRATPLEVSAYDLVQGSASMPVISTLKSSSKYVELGSLPTAQELNEAGGMSSERISRQEQSDMGRPVSHGSNSSEFKGDSVQGRLVSNEPNPSESHPTTRTEEQEPFCNEPLVPLAGSSDDHLKKRTQHKKGSKTKCCQNAKAHQETACAKEDFRLYPRTCTYR